MKYFVSVYDEFGIIANGDFSLGTRIEFLFINGVSVKLPIVNYHHKKGESTLWIEVDLPEFLVPGIMNGIEDAKHDWIDFNLELTDDEVHFDWFIGPDTFDLKKHLGHLNSLVLGS